MIDRILNIIERIFIKSLSGILIGLGAALLSPGLFEGIIYVYDTMILSKDIPSPGSSFGWEQKLSCVFIFLGVVIKFLEGIGPTKKKINEDRLWLRENYESLSDDKLQDEFERLYKVKSADVRAIKNILSHPYNKKHVITLFQVCYLNVLPKDDWFVEKGNYLALRYNLGFSFWLLFPVLIILSLLLAASEYISPGITNYGEFGVYYYLIMAILAFIGAWQMLSEISGLGGAITLVKKYNPNNI